MQRWQRRAHLWLWLIVAIVVATVLAKLVDDETALLASPASATAQ